MALFGSLSTVRSQAPRTAAYATAWKYLDDLQRRGSVVQQRVGAMAAGASQKLEIGNGVFAIEQAYETKPRAEGFFESHRKYIDIQVVVSGQETMEVIDVSRASVKEQYVDERDLIVYQDAPAASPLRFEAGDAAVFYPEDVHMPSLRSAAAPVLVRKVVLKLPVNE